MPIINAGGFFRPFGKKRRSRAANPPELGTGNRQQPTANGQRYSLYLRVSVLKWREDQKPLRFRKKKKNIFGCHLANAAACEKTPRRSQKGQKRIVHEVFLSHVRADLSLGFARSGARSGGFEIRPRLILGFLIR